MGGKLRKGWVERPYGSGHVETKDRIQQILFASRIRKYNKRFKSSERAILITEASVYKLDGKTFKPMKNKTPLVEVNMSSKL